MNSTKRLSINLIANIVSYSTSIIIAFLLTPYLIRVLGKEAYSFYPMANNFVQYMGIITTALNSMASRFITIEITKNNTEKANIYFSSVFYSNVILSIVLFIPMLLIVVFLDKIINIPMDLVFSIQLLFTFVFLSMLVNLITSVFGVAVFAKNRIDLRSIGDILHSLLKVILYIVFFFFFHPSIIYVGVVAFILSIVYFIIHSIYTRKLLPEMKISFAYFDYKSIKEMLISGIWNSVNQIGSILLFSLAILYCNILIGPSAAGEYSIIQTVPNFVNGIISMLAAVFQPILTQTYAVGTIEDLVREAKRSQKIMGMITNIPIAVFMAVGYEFYLLWVPGENAFRLHILSILTITHLLLIGVTWTINNLNTVINKVRVPALYMILSGVLNFFVVLILTKTTNLGVYCIPLSSIFILLIWAGVFIPIYPCIELKLKWYTFYSAIIKTIISSIIIIVFSVGIKSLIVINSWPKMFLVCFICGLFGLLVNSFVVLDKNDRKGIFTYFKLVLKRIGVI